MQSEPEVLELLTRHITQWRAQVGGPIVDRKAQIVCEALNRIVEELDLELPSTNDEAAVDSIRHLADVLMQLPGTNVWTDHAVQPDGCRLHGAVRGTLGDSYTGCDRLGWIGDKLLNAKYGVKDIWPEPGVWSSWFESSRARH